MIVGDVTNAGTILPGVSISDPGALHITGNYTQQSTGALKAALASGTDYTALDVTGSLALAGTLSVNAIGFSPLLGHAFDLLNWGLTRTGTFSTLDLPPLGSGLTWDTSQLYTLGIISVLGPNGLAGDFNQNGVVDAGDYVVWRNSGGSQAAYTQWRMNFGRTAGSGSTAGQLIPEPASAVIAFGSLFALAASRLGRDNRPHARRVFLRSVC